MRGRVPAFWVLLVLLPACGGKGVPGSVPSGPLGLALHLKPSRVELGRPALLTMVLRKDPGVKAEAPSLDAVYGKPGKVKILAGSRKTFRLPSGAEVEERTWRVFPFQAGRLSFPALSVKGRYRGKEITARAGPLELQVKSALPPRDEGVEEPSKPLEPPSGFPWPWVAGLGGALLLAGLLAWLLGRKKKKEGPSLPPPLPPHVEALRALARIRKLPRNTPEQVERVVVEASGVVRRYIEKRFGLRAPERTTEEFLAEAGCSGRLGPGERELLESFLFECDRAKFAGWTPPPEKQEALLDAAEAFVEKTAPGGREGRG